MGQVHALTHPGARHRGTAPAASPPDPGDAEALLDALDAEDDDAP